MNLTIFIGLIIVVYLGMSLGIYVRVLSSKQTNKALGPSFLSPFFYIIFIIYGVKMAFKKEIDKKTYWKAIRHFDDVMFLFVIVCVINREENDKDSWKNLNESVYDGLHAY